MLAIAEARHERGEPMRHAPAVFGQRSIGSGGDELLVDGVVGVAAGVEGVEGVAVVGVERETLLDAFGQVGVGDEVTSEGYEVRMSCGYDVFGGVGLEATCGDDFVFEDLS